MKRSQKSATNGVPYAVDIVELSKSFRRATRGRGAYTTLKTSLISLLFGRQKDSGHFTHAIKDFTMRIPQGTSVGVIGRNGSGKSTLLKLITGIYKADRGVVRVNGRIAALIELGAGFHPDFTGRENLFLAGVMHGLKRSEIEDRFEEIVEFAELEDVIDDPVRTYSSGMFMRLGFSLAVHTDPDILIVDEVLAVGDATFVAKCKERLAQLRKEGKTLILVTHDLSAVERWCDDVIWLDQGEVQDRGEPRRVIDAYRHFVERGEEQELVEAATRQSEVEETQPEETDVAEPTSEGESQRWGSREVEITEVRLTDADGAECRVVRSDAEVCIEVDYHVREHTDDIVFGIGIHRSDGLVVHGTNTAIEELKLPELGTHGTVKYRVPRIGLLDGRYRLDIAVHRSDGYPYDYRQGALTFAVRWPLNQLGVILPDHRWEFVTGAGVTREGSTGGTVC